MRIILAHRLCLLFALLAVTASAPAAEPLVPGTGRKVANVGDDFEEEDWEYIFNGPKSTEDVNKNQNMPTGESKNGRWYEGIKRGHPDIVRRVATPAGGLPGSRGSLLLQSLHTGIPGRPSYTMHQDDFICDVNYRLGYAIPIEQSPSVVVRVFLPPVAKWEDRSGPQFAFRLALDTTVVKRPENSFFASPRPMNEVYWPGMFIEFESKTDSGGEHDYAFIRIRADEYGNDFRTKQITTTGWWTLGMSVTPDNRVHYYAKPGLEDLTSDDHITSQTPYGFKPEGFRTFFFNVCNGDDGRTWSTPWIIDDPALYVKFAGRRTAESD